ncbi:MAG: hypothetical protein K8R53_02320, partial [Bacteroidales bacterium]|nr:hypothetical protein [Bacteroidales bacterium]
MRFTLILLILLVSFSAFTEEVIISESLDWKKSGLVVREGDFAREMLHFDGAVHEPESFFLPELEMVVPITPGNIPVKTEIKNMVLETIAPEDLANIEGVELISHNISLKTSLQYSSGNPYLKIELIPVRLNDFSGFYDKIVKFDLVVTLQAEPLTKSGKNNREYAAVSVLAGGDWYKVAVQSTGVYKISYNDLESMGISPGNIDPEKISIHGNGCGMLHEDLDITRADDLVELAIEVVG